MIKTLPYRIDVKTRAGWVACEYSVSFEKLYSYIQAIEERYGKDCDMRLLHYENGEWEVIGW